MTMIPLPPYLEATLRKRAEATGLSLEDYVWGKLDPILDEDPDFTAGTNTPPDENFRALTAAEERGLVEILSRPPRNPSPALRKLLHDL